jgi:hypothetical protein
MAQSFRRTRARNRCQPARPYIERLMNPNRFPDLPPVRYSTTHSTPRQPLIRPHAGPSQSSSTYSPPIAPLCSISPTRAGSVLADHSYQLRCHPHVFARHGKSERRRSHSFGSAFCSGGLSWDLGSKNWVSRSRSRPRTLHNADYFHSSRFTNEDPRLSSRGPLGFSTVGACCGGFVAEGTTNVDTR